MPYGIVTRLVLPPKTTSTTEKAPTIGPATLAKFDGVQLLLLSRITRAKRDGGGVPANWFSESQ